MTHPTIGTRDFHLTGTDRWWKRRSFGMDSDGLWGMVTREKGPRMVFHKNAIGWSFSVSAFGRNALVGRMLKANVALDVHVVDDDEDLW